MAEKELAEGENATTELEEAEWRRHVLEEMHLIRRALERIADRVGGIGGA